MAMLSNLDLIRRVPLFSRPDAQGQMMIRDKVSRSDIAKMVGASREMVSRVMKDLEERGFVEMLDSGSMIVKENLASPNGTVPG